MTRIQRLSLFLVCLFAVPLFAADAGQNFAGDGLQFSAFPTISKSQERRPLNVSTASDYPCGWTADLPQNCRWACYPDGTPILNPDGTQQVRCRPTKTYPGDDNGTCNKYYGCTGTSPQYPYPACSYTGVAEACVFLGETTGCTSCSFW